MEDCGICYTSFSECSEVKTLSCNHQLCARCYLRLQTQKCPYCRHEFKYDKEDIIKRQLIHNYTPPTQQSNNNNQIELNNSFYIFDFNSFNQLEIYTRPRNIPFSNINRKRNRKRRRDLSEEDILERRRIIRDKCRRKWSHKEARINKIKWYEIN